MGSGRSADRLVLIAFGVCVAAQLLFVLAFDPFPGEDTAAHLASANGFLAFVSGRSPIASRVLEWNLIPVPNLLPQLALTALMQLVGPRWAERLLVLGYVALLPIVAVWVIRQARSGATPLAFFVLFLTFNVPFMWGFLNFSYSIVGFLFVAGLLMRWQGQLDWRRAALLALLLIVVFFTHLVGYLEASLVAACVLGATAMASERRLIALTRAVAALAPAAVLTLIFLISTRSAPAVADFDPLWKLRELVLLTGGIPTYDRAEKIACVLYALLVWGLMLIAVLRGRGRWFARPVPAGLAAFMLLSSCIAVFAPEEIQTGGTLGSIRYMLFPVLGAILWLAWQELPFRLLMPASAAAVFASGALAAIRYDAMREIEAALHDLRAVESCFAPGSTVVQANLRHAEFGSLGRYSRLASEEGRLTVARNGFDLGTIDWGVPFGLLKFRKEMNPYTHLVRPGFGHFSIETAPPPFELDGFERSTGISLDYILVFGRSLPQGALEMPQWEMSAQQADIELSRFEATLRDRYALVKTSPLGVWELWKKRSPGRDSSASACAG